MNNFKFLIIIFTFSFFIFNLKVVSAASAKPAAPSGNYQVKETVFEVPPEALRKTVPLVVNVEVKEEGRVEHLLNFAYEKLRDPVLTVGITSVFWLLVIMVIRKKQRRK